MLTLPEIADELKLVPRPDGGWDAYLDDKLLGMVEPSGLVLTPGSVSVQIVGFKAPERPLSFGDFRALNVVALVEP